MVDFSVLLTKSYCLGRQNRLYKKKLPVPEELVSIWLELLSGRTP
jgi:hypothetical protein